MKRHGKSDRSWQPALACIIGIAIIFWAASAWGADFYCPATFAANVDSSVWVIWQGSAVRDSNTVVKDESGHQYHDTTFTVNSESTYTAKLYYWAPGVVAAMWSFDRAPIGVAAISVDDMKDIAGHVDDTLAWEHGAGGWTTGAGSGAINVRIYAVADGTDSIMGVNITVRTLANVYDGNLITHSRGEADFTLLAESLIILGSKAGYVWTTDTIYYTAADSTSIAGTSIAPGSSPLPNYCRVWGYVQGPNELVAGAFVTFTPVTGDGTKNNICDSIIMLPLPTVVESSHDTVGYFYADLLYSSCFEDTLKYIMTIDYEGTKSEPEYITVPDSASYRINY